MLWTLARLLPSADHAFLQGLPRSEGPIGPDFPARWSAAQHLTATDAEGLLAHPERLPATSAQIRDFYATTHRYALRGQARFAWWARLGLRLSRRWLLDGWRQLQLPLDGDLDLPDRFVAVGDERWWVRSSDSTTMYCARFDVVDLPSGPHLRVAFPLPGATLVGLLRGEGGDGPLVWSQTQGDTGLYVLPPTGPARRVPLIRETITVAAVRGGVAARHTFHLLGWEMLRFLYLCEPRRGP